MAVMVMMMGMMKNESKLFRIILDIQKNKNLFPPKAQHNWSVEIRGAS